MVVRIMVFCKWLRRIKRTHTAAAAALINPRRFIFILKKNKEEFRLKVRVCVVWGGHEYGKKRGPRIYLYACQHDSPRSYHIYKNKNKKRLFYFFFHFHFDFGLVRFVFGPFSFSCFSCFLCFNLNDSLFLLLFYLSIFLFLTKESLITRCCFVWYTV